MAVQTLTASDQTATPRLVHAGVTAARATYTHGGATSLSASDIIFMIKIPNQTWILDGYIKGTCGGSTNSFKVGTVADDDACGTLLTLSETQQFRRFADSQGAGIGTANTMPFKVSLSDSARPQYTWLQLTFSGVSATATASIDVVVLYAPDGAMS